MKILENIRIKKNSSSITFNEVTRKWIEYKSLNLKESTIANYQYTIDKYLMKYLSDKTILELEKYDFNNIVIELNKELEPKTVRDIVSILKAILYYAEDELKCKFQINKIQMPKLNGKNIKILSRIEKNKLGTYCLKESNLTTLRSIYGSKYRFEDRRNMCSKI